MRQHVFHTGFHCIAQASLKPMIPLPQPTGLQVCTAIPGSRLFFNVCHDGSRVSMCTDHIKQGVRGYTDVCE